MTISRSRCNPNQFCLLLLSTGGVSMLCGLRVWFLAGLGPGTEATTVTHAGQRLKKRENLGLSDSG